MHLGVLSLFPDMFAALTEYGVSGRAVERGLLELTVVNPRDFTKDKHRTVDDKPYGGGPGMVMKAQPLADSLAHLKTQMPAGAPVVYLSPQGQRLTQSAVERFSVMPAVIMVAGRYEGVDERFIEEHVDEEWSIGDFVVSGGELPAMLLMDAMIRLLPGALGDEQSAQQDSFSNGLLDYPHYTRPERVGESQVPAVLMSGDHEKIRQWRAEQALLRTWQRRPDLLENGFELNEEQSKMLAQARQQTKGEDQ
ncbi:MAG: tRNA (guanosine(37)-N1)-methyltransferase TrmD [Pseudomonadales bacterium]